MPSLNGIIPTIWPKKKADSPSGSIESSPSSSSMAPTVPGAYPDDPPPNRANGGGNRTSASNSQQRDQGGDPNRGTASTNGRQTNGSSASTTLALRTGSAPSSPSNRENQNPRSYSQVANGVGLNSSNRFASLDGLDPAFSMSLVISARGSDPLRDHTTVPRDTRTTTGVRNGPQATLSGRDGGWSDAGGRSSSTPAFSSTPGSRRKIHLKRMATETVTALESGVYHDRGVEVNIAGQIDSVIKDTQFYGPDTPRLVHWLTGGRPAPVNGDRGLQTKTQVSVLNISTLAGARLLENVYQRMPGAGDGSATNPNKCSTGVLNFASATKPGGGFENGAEAQEESLARASTLFASLKCSKEAQKFYTLHTQESRENLLAYYSHAIVYSPGVLVLRDDEDGAWFETPFAVDVLSCAAVNAGEVRRSTSGGSRPNRVTTAHLEVDIEKEMTERMARILCVFETQGVRNLVLGTFGTGVFQNKVDVVARIWAHLLIRPEARFKDVFDRVIFAITGQDTFGEFQASFAAWGHERAAGHGRASAPASRNAPTGGNDGPNLIDFDQPLQ